MPERRALGALLPSIVTRLAERLNVVLVPKELLVAVVRLAVIGDQSRRVGAGEPATGPLTRVEVSGEHALAQRPPFRRVVELPPRREERALLSLGALDRTQHAKRRLQPGKLASDGFELSHGCGDQAAARSTVIACQAASGVGRE